MSVEAQFTLSEDRLYRDEGPESGLKSIKENRVSESSVLILSVSQRLRILSNQSFFAKVCFTTMLTDGSSKWKKFRSCSERRESPAQRPSMAFFGVLERMHVRRTAAMSPDRPMLHNARMSASDELFLTQVLSEAAMCTGVSCTVVKPMRILPAIVNKQLDQAAS